MQQDLISIVIPVYNQERYLAETIHTIKAQTCRDWEAIWVDDGSTDGSLDILERLATDSPAGPLGQTAEGTAASGMAVSAEAAAVPAQAPSGTSAEAMRLVRLEKNGGVANARNRGVMAARGRYLVFLDADDLWKPEKLERQLAFMKETGAAFSFTDYEFADESGNGTGKVTRIPARIAYKQALGNTTIFTSTVMLDREQLPEKLLYMPAVESEDTAAWWRILKAGYDGYGLQENLTYYRRPGRSRGQGRGSLSSNKMKAVRRIWRLYRVQEGLGIMASAWYFVQYAWHAVMRRI